MFAHVQAWIVGSRTPFHRPMTATVTDDAEGKPVVHDDRAVGVVTTVEEGTAYVEPDSGISEEIRATLGWSDGQEVYPLPETAIAEVAAGEVRLHHTP